MVPRYARPEMTALWEPEARFRIWLEIETLAAEAMAKLGQVPKSVPKSLRAKGRFEVARVDEIEKTTKHDVIAFLTNVAEQYHSISPNGEAASNPEALQKFLLGEMARWEKVVKKYNIKADT